MFVVSCDLDASTKLGKARGFLAPDHQFEMSIEEQASALLANGLAMSSAEPRLNVISTFAAFFEGIAREGFDMWRYQRNLNGVNEGLNVAYHLSHVGACTGRDHFSGWGLDWINVGLTYLPYLHRFYAPADARAAFVAVRDLAAHYGGHVIGIPRDELPILEKQDGSGPLWQADDGWEPVTACRTFPGAKRAILAFGAPAFLGAEAAARLAKKGLAADVHIVNGLPLPPSALEKLLARYTRGRGDRRGRIHRHRADRSPRLRRTGRRHGETRAAAGPHRDHRPAHRPFRGAHGDVGTLRDHGAGHYRRRCRLVMEEPRNHVGWETGCELSVRPPMDPRPHGTWQVFSFFLPSPMEHPDMPDCHTSRLRGHH